MHARLMDELDVRVATGSELLIAVREDDSPAADCTPGEYNAFGQYVEPGPRAFGCVEVSTREIQQCATLSQGLYVSHMAVAAADRRRGIGLALLRAVDEYATRQGKSSIYLHVRRDNEGAIALYQREGYLRAPEAPAFEALTRQLQLDEQALLYRKELQR